MLPLLLDYSKFGFALFTSIQSMVPMRAIDGDGDDYSVSFSRLGTKHSCTSPFISPVPLEPVDIAQPNPCQRE